MLHNWKNEHRGNTYATQPKEDDGELTEMRTKYFSRDLLQITGMAIEIVSISINYDLEVDPGQVFGSIMT
ncbi:hypothetical protein L6452_45626 [Arctium lappa]|nr:hypothetical protein L6452_45626 [Arctium lappa]